MQGDYNYEEERKKLKLGPFTTCVMIFKTTVGVGIFTFQYCYARCGIFWGTILSSAVFFCTIFGIRQLLQLCNDIENDENGQTTVEIKDTEQTTDFDQTEDIDSKFPFMHPLNCYETLD